ncbi:MAG: hypothetical protein CMG13_00715 [Candidatus Marinimicrobia bacterium]|nr:hypothetical protein [Candidatus Neomarinimicrobiota bacterium]|tara:strand:- start:4229 stop:5356 length:1128 start_codon:yes stop_codon:yes gene_type:complete
MNNRNIVSSLVENLFWLLPLTIIFFVLDYIYPIFLILVIGYIGYIILDPIVCKIERIIRTRALAVLIVLAMLITPIYFGISSLVTLLSKQYSSVYELITDDEGYFTIEELTETIEPKIIKVAPDQYGKNIKDFFQEINSESKKERIANMIPDYFNFQNTIYLFSWITSIIMFLIITVAFTSTMLLSAQKFKKSFIKMVPNRYFEMSLKIIDRISDQISSYVRGTLTAAFIVGALSIIGLNILCSVTDMQHDYIILVGVLAGLFNLIPFIGPMIGGVLAILFFLITGQASGFELQYYHILFIMFTFAGVQLIDNLISSPFIISDSVGLHPMFVIIVVMVGGSILGPLGMIISVPLAAVLKVIVEELIWGFKNYRYL